MSGDGIVAPATCMVTDGYCQFQATKASYYATVTGFSSNSNTSSSNSSNSSSSSSHSFSQSYYVCGDTKPIGIPDLFQINTKRNNAQLFFTPVNANSSYYLISYGYTEGDERFGVTVPFNYSTGVLNYTVNYLQPNTNYFFKIRTGNGCMPGDWSSTLNAKTTGNTRSTQNYYKYSNKKK